MLSDITLGQYFPGRSILHRMDPRAKMVLVLVAIVLIFTAFNFLSMGLVVALILTAMLLSGVPIKMYMKSMKAILFIVAFTSILNLFYGSGEPLVQWGFMQITLNGIYRCIFIAIRITGADSVQLDSDFYHIAHPAYRCHGAADEALEGF